MGRVTIKDIARKAGVSDATVSLSFQPDSRISAATRRKVLSIARKHSYVPNLAARDLRYGRSRSIGILVTEITNPWYAVLIRHAQEVVHEKGYQLLIAESQWSAETELAAIDSMAQMRVQGLLFCCSETNCTCFTMLKKFGLPYLLLDTYPRGYRGAYVENDLVAVGDMAARHLIDSGCRSLAFLSGSRKDARFSSFRKLRTGFGNTVRNNGLEWGPQRWVHAGFTIEQGRKAMDMLVSSGLGIDGVFCVNDLCAMGAMEALDSKGAEPGPSVAVVGVDDNAASALSRISLTSVRFPYADIARIGAHSLIDTIEGRLKKSVRKSVKPELVVRDTTRAFRTRGGER